MITIITIVIALVLLLIGCVCVDNQISLRRGRLITVGTVVELPVRVDLHAPKGPLTYHRIVIAFTDPDQKPYRFTSDEIQGAPARKVGDPINIHYPRLRPTDGGICTFHDCFGSAVVCLFIAFTMLFILGAWWSASSLFNVVYPIQAQAPPMAAEGQP